MLAGCLSLGSHQDQASSNNLPTTINAIGQTLSMFGVPYAGAITTALTALGWGISSKGRRKEKSKAKDQAAHYDRAIAESITDGSDRNVIVTTDLILRLQQNRV